MVDMGDDGNIADFLRRKHNYFFVGRGSFELPLGFKFYWFLISLSLSIAAPMAKRVSRIDFCWVLSFLTSLSFSLRITSHSPVLLDFRCCLAFITSSKRFACASISVSRFCATA